ncbi:MAG: hypothetical protein IT377_04065 [Polyangiaceae bacterium]|nr:hypothetical protein [Polyangiaceae bacterium]
MNTAAAKAHVEHTLNSEDLEPVVVIELIEKPYGWVCFYQSVRYLETGEESAQLVGNGPVVLMRDTLQIHHLGSARRPDEELAQFELRHGLGK